jgi:hypothetical protein
MIRRASGVLTLVSLVSLVSAASLLGLLACGGVDPQPPQSTPPMTTASAAPVATETAAPPPAPVDPRAEAWSPPDTGGQAASPDVIEQACPVMAKQFKSDRVKSPDDARVVLDEMTKSPPPIPKAQFEWCHDQISRMIDVASRAMTEGEGKMGLGAIARGMVVAFEREQPAVAGAPAAPKPVVRKLCPSAKAVPAKLAEAGVKYSSTTAEWSKDPGWTCLKFSMERPQLFQYEVKVTPGKGFVAYARRKDGNELLELSVHGDIKKDVIELSKEIDEKRTPAPAHAK